MDIFKDKNGDPHPEGLICRIPLAADEKELYTKAGTPPRMSDITWRIFRIMAEFVEGFQFLSKISHEVTVFGSARTPSTNRWYQVAVRLGELLGEAGFTVVSGGGPGIMEAANRGAHNVGAQSVGLNIQLPHEQRVNPYVKSSRAFYYFFTRKVILAASAQAYVYFPGGFGTMDELFEILTLIQTKKSEPVPVVLVGKDYWSGLDSFIKETLYSEYETISREDMDLYHIVDSAEEAFEIIKDTKERTFFSLCLRDFGIYLSLFYTLAVRSFPGGEEVIEVTAPASTAASLYEKVRTVVDYQEEHLLRRNAILRILKRYLGSDVPIEKMAMNLLKELIWAKYLPNKEVPTRFSKELVPIFMKYEPLLRAVDDVSGKKDEAFAWVLDVMSTEIEYAITPPVAEEALVSYMYEEMRDRIFWDPKIAVSDEDKDLRLYIAIHKMLLGSNIATLRFRVMTLYYTDWPGASTQARIKDIAKNLDSIIQTIDYQIQNPASEKLAIMIRRKAGLFRVIRDVIEEHPDDFEALLADPDVLDREVAKTLKRRTKAFREKLRRTILRAVGFLFITKMFLALIIELPYDLLIAHDASLMPLFVNILFHPLFLGFIGLTATIQERKNTEDYVSAMRALVVGADHELLNVRVKRETFGAWGKVFGVVYGLMFLFTYGVISTFLIRIGFNWLSVSLFLFFLSLVTFFGIRIRTSTKDIVLSNARQGVFGSMFDAFMLPIVRAGRWLSLKVSKINVFIYFFDFIIESPYKVVVRFIEGWVGFIREKKEEI